MEEGSHAGLPPRLGRLLARKAGTRLLGSRGEEDDAGVSGERVDE